MEAGQTGGRWTDQENDLIVADYFSMLLAELTGQPANKTKHREALARSLTQRNTKSIEFKHMNVSAVMLGMGQPRVTGYAPAANFQLSLVDAVLRWLTKRPDWIPQTIYTDRRNAIGAAAFHEESALWFEPPPTLANVPPPVNPTLLAAVLTKVDVAAMDARNAALGQAGEERVLDHERAVLSAAGRRDLSDQIVWASKEEGDGLGFDIRSFELTGDPRLIEVKTTNGWNRTPFHISANELAVADANRETWCLVRLFDFAKEPRAFELRPPLQRHVELTPTSFLAKLN